MLSLVLTLTGRLFNMAGTLTLDTLKSSSGVLATQNGMTGIAKAWASYDFVGSGTVPTLRSSFNISSITRNSTGNTTLAFITPLTDANYSCIGYGTQGGTLLYSLPLLSTSRTTTSVVVINGYTASAPSTTLYDNGFDVAIFGA